MKNIAKSLSLKLVNFIFKLIFMFFFTLVMCYLILWGISSSIIFNNILIMITTLLLMLYLAIIHTEKVYKLINQILGIKPLMFYITFIAFAWLIWYYSMDLYEYIITQNAEAAISEVGVYYLLFGIKLYPFLMFLFLLYVSIYLFFKLARPKIKKKINNLEQKIKEKQNLIENNISDKKDAEIDKTAIEDENEDVDIYI